MRKNVIVVCDQEEAYACRLADYMNQKKKLPFRAEVFTDVKKFCEYAGKNPPELLLLSEKQREVLETAGEIQNIVLLFEDREEQPQDYKSVYKYQSADAVLQEVMEYYAENDKSWERRAGGTLKIIGVYAPGRSGEGTVFSLGAGMLLAQKKRTLYMNLEGCAGFEELFARTYAKNLSDLFYEEQFLKEGGNWDIEGTIVRAGELEYIPPARTAEDIRAVEFSQWARLLEWISQRNCYEILILDLGESVDGFFSVLDFCSSIYLLSGQDTVSRCRAEAFKKLRRQWKNGEEERSVREISGFSFLGNRRGEDFWEELLCGPWGEKVRKALEEDGWLS